MRKIYFSLFLVTLTQTFQLVQAAPLRVLVAEDLPGQRKVLVRSIRKVFREVIITEAENGKEALDIWQQKGLFDAVISDNHMPVLMGVEWVEKIRQLPEGKNQVVFFFSSTIQEEEFVRKAASLNPAGIFEKGTGLRTLIESLKGLFPSAMTQPAPSPVPLGVPPSDPSEQHDSTTHRDNPPSQQYLAVPSDNPARPRSKSPS